MKWLTLGAACLVALFALCAGAATSALAAPEYGVCVKAAKSSGEYNDKNCQERNGSHTGKFNFVPGPGAKPKFVGKGKTVVLSTPDIGGKVTCDDVINIWIILAVAEASNNSTFTGCTTEGKKCSSAGESAGTIKTNELTSELIFGSHSEVLVNVLSKAGPEGVLAEFSCEGLLVRTRGTVAGLQTGNVNAMSKKSKTTFSGNEETLLVEVSVDGGLEYLGPFPSSLVDNETNKSEEKFEIKT
jgi:hypothetical protein